MYYTHISVAIYISEDVYCTILFRVEEFSGFQCAKTSVNKRLLCLVMSRFEVLRAGFSRPHCPSVNHYGCKGTTFF